jgi:anti-anti-sigma factor
MAQQQERLTSVEARHDVIVVTFNVPHVGIDSEPKLREELDSAIIGIEHPRVLVDLDGVSYVSSGPLGVFTAFERQISEEKGQLKFCGVKAYVMETLRAAGLLRLFDVFNNCEEALADFGSSPGATVSSDD